MGSFSKFFYWLGILVTILRARIGDRFCFVNFCGETFCSGSSCLLYRAWWKAAPTNDNSWGAHISLKFFLENPSGALSLCVSSLLLSLPAQPACRHLTTASLHLSQPSDLCVNRRHQQLTLTQHASAHLQGKPSSNAFSIVVGQD